MPAMCRSRAVTRVGASSNHVSGTSVKIHANLNHVVQIRVGLHPPPNLFPQLPQYLSGFRATMKLVLSGLVSGLYGESGSYSLPTPTLKNHFRGSTSSVV